VGGGESADARGTGGVPQLDVAVLSGRRVHASIVAVSDLEKKMVQVAELMARDNQVKSMGEVSGTMFTVDE
jgi:hypothetical protein